MKSFVEFIKFVLVLPEVKDKKLSFLSQNLCQDPLENFFGCQRQRGGTSDNPSVVDFYNNTQSLRVVDSFCRGPVRGNCRVTGDKSHETSSKDDCVPLQKRQKSPKTPSNPRI